MKNPGNGHTAGLLTLFLLTISISLLASAQALEGLPFELRQVVSRFPVVLYTGENCTPCNSARNLLTTRGVPLIEYTISSPEDAQALRALSGGSALPLITVGRQKITGFDERELREFLDLAGYPKTSILPRSYRHPAATALVAATQAAGQTSAIARTEPAAPVPETAKPPLPDAATANPAGIRF